MFRTFASTAVIVILTGASLVVAPPSAGAEAAPVFLSRWGTAGTGDGQFDDTAGVAVDPDGSVYVTDYLNDRVQRFTATGTYLGQWGTNGDGDGEFDHPAGVAVDADGDVYVADAYNHRIQRFTATGTYLGQWGTNGTGNGEFRYPFGVAFGESGEVYVSDEHNHRIQRFTATGTYLGQWGTNGTGDGQFTYPDELAVNADGDVYVADNFNHRVQRFTATGTYLGQWGTWGTLDGQFHGPTGLAIDTDGDVYVADTGSHRMQKFTATGTHLSTWGTNGTGDGQFSSPWGVDVGADGRIYVADHGNDRVQVFAQDTIDPTVELRVPAEAATFGRGQVVAADFGCEDEVGGSGLDACVGTVADGDPIETSTLGSHEFSVTATDNAGNTATVTHSFTVVPTGVVGTVTESPSGGPVEGLWVVGVSTAGQMTAATLTDAAGGYSLSLPVGSYKIEFVDPTGRHVGEWFENAPLGDFGAGQVVTVSGPTEVRVDADLAASGASGVIAGTVTETGSPDTIGGAWVVAVRSHDGRIVAGVLSGSDGTFRVGGLVEGSYRLAVIDPTMAHAYDLFFDDKADFTTGDDIAVVAGEVTTVNPDLDRATPPTPNATIEGAVTDTVTGDPVAGAWVAAVNKNTGVFTVATEADDAGRYSLSLPAGPYALEFIDPSGTHRGEWFGDVSLGEFGAATPVTVSAGATVVADEDLVPLTGAIVGRVTNSSTGSGIAGAWVIAVRSYNGEMVVWDVTADDGSFRVAGLDPVNHRVAVIDPTGVHEIELFYNNHSDFSHGDDITVDPGAAPPSITIDLTPR